MLLLMLLLPLLDLTEADEAAAASDVSFVGDLVFPVIGDADDVGPRVSAVLTILHEIFPEHASVVYFMTGKL
eukprot:2424610-Karenia_brevis.AAC.1